MEFESYNRSDIVSELTDTSVGLSNPSINNEDMKLKEVFKRRVGGTALGNTIRGIANRVSGGILGNGVFMLRSDGSQPNNETISRAAGAAAETFRARAKSEEIEQPKTALSKITDAFKSGVIMEKIKQYWLFLAVAALGIFVLLNRKKGNQPRRKRY